MQILILINVQYLQNVVFSFEKGLNGQNYSSSDFHHLIKKSHTKISHSSTGKIPTYLKNPVEKMGVQIKA